MKRLSILALCAAMTGCATTIGDPEFSCKGYSEAGYSCKSAREVYELTNDAAGPVTDLGYQAAPGHQPVQTSTQTSTVSPGHPRSDVGVHRTTASSGQPDAPKVVVVPHNVRVQSPKVLTGPTPIRTQAQVMRVWINTYEDNAGALHSPQLVYNEIVERKWRFGNQAKDRSSETPVVRSSRTARSAGSQPTPVGE
ncbi:type IV conjugative transfer system lipoprotein TraV [Marinobacter sp. P4B1]|uniref:type IV conjugative transfer system lipoprotein TraV n=1 Tax=Marinobacter sp. P4B1 TaxID=1119533 RepID=UPI0009EAEF78|nr:type IV conjugative transfer system lipoprotein TraV [Marinobacter sp. P4B1]